ncbi:MAG: RNA polymerase sigma factor [Phycisphaerales bacterium]|nr:RNA polymerase sigma factor [Phycisphaerales bacterium]
MTRTKSQILSEFLVLQAQTGDAKALGQLVEMWSHRLNNRAIKLIGDREAALDAAQEAWISIARSIRSLRDPALFGPWAMRIVQLKSADAIRSMIRDRKLKHSYAHEVSNHTEPTDPAPVRTAILLLAPKYRDVVILHYMDGCSTEIIAVILNIPIGTVKTRLRRARAQLKPILERTDSHG